MLVVRVLIGLQRLAVTVPGLVELALDVRDDAEVLLGPRAQLASCAGETQRFEEMGTRIVERARLDVEAAERVQRFGGEQRIVTLDRHRLAALTQFPRQR